MQTRRFVFVLVRVPSDDVAARLDENIQLACAIKKPLLIIFKWHSDCRISSRADSKIELIDTTTSSVCRHFAWLWSDLWCVSSQYRHGQWRQCELRWLLCRCVTWDTSSTIRSFLLAGRSPCAIVSYAFEFWSRYLRIGLMLLRCTKCHQVWNTNRREVGSFSDEFHRLSFIKSFLDAIRAVNSWADLRWWQGIFNCHHAPEVAVCPVNYSRAAARHATR